MSDIKKKKKKKKRKNSINYEEEISASLKEIDSVRLLWKFEEDPGPGEYKFGNKYQLRVVDRIDKKGNTRNYIVELCDRPGYPLTMCSDWSLFCKNLKTENNKNEKEIDMSKMSIHDTKLRNKIKLKCENDWGLDLTEEQISMCIIEMQEQKLSLFHNQIWPNKRRFKKDPRIEIWSDRITWDKTIDGYRAVAHRSGRFAGMDAASFEEDSDGSLIARITVYALDSSGTPRGYVGEARFNEFVQLVDEWNNGKKTGKKLPNNQWSESPYNQLSVAAERQALRKAFQDLDADSKGFVYAPEPDLEQANLSQSPEPEPEQSRGLGAPPESRLAVSKVKLPESSQASKGDETPSEKSENIKTKDGVYVGVPKAGYEAYKMYNKNERIIMYAVNKSGMHHLALDSGDKVVVNPEGYEIERIPRTDQSKGGRKWKKGDLYYDASTVERIADSKNDEFSIWLGLDNGFKVCLDQWGKQIKRKDLKKNQGSEESPKSSSVVEGEVVDRPPGNAEPINIPYQETVAHGVVSRIPEAETPGSESDEIDIEAIDNVDMMRKITTPLLKKWCDDVAKKRMNPKDAYKEFTGISLSKGQAMSLDDYKVLHTCLEEAIKDSESN